VDVVVPGEVCGEVLRLLCRALVAEARSTGALPSARCRDLLVQLHRAATTPPTPAESFAEETTTVAALTLEPLMTVAQVAGVLGCSPQWARRLVSSSRLAAHRVGRQWLVETASLDEYRYGGRRA
jgi:excisionase family DNA binding protein